MSTPVDARIMKSRAALKQALLDLLETTSFGDVSVRAIAKKAGVGYATFFRHYEGKEELLAAVADELIAELAGVVAPLMLQGEVEEAALAIARYVDARPAACDALLVGAADTLRRRISDEAVARAKTFPAMGEGALPADLVIIHGVSACLTILSWWRASERRQSPKQIAQLIERLAFAPLLNAGGTHS